MARAKTLTGLLLQAIALRWNALGTKGKTLLVAGIVLAGAVGLHLGMCALGGGCAASGPCSLGSPCAGATSEEPCQLGAANDDVVDGEGVAVEAETPPCHAR